MPRPNRCSIERRVWEQAITEAKLKAAGYKDMCRTSIEALVEDWEEKLRDLERDTKQSV